MPIGEDIVIRPGVVVHDDELEEAFIRASGPGGQNVNKVATAVELRFNLAQSPLPDDVKRRLRSLAGSRLTVDDEIVIDAREHRTQTKNREAARARLIALIRQAATRPRVRRKTAPSAASRERRLDTKIRRSRTKARRSGKIESD